jgi:hypothetical protein
MPDWIFKNKPTAYATLASPSGTSGTTLTLTTGHGTRLPAPGAGQISAVRIENELITYTGNSGDVLTGVTRGAGATNHVAGTEVKNVLVEEWANAVTALSTDTKAALAGTSGTPQAANPYVTNADARNSDARAPTAHSHVEGDTTGLVADLAARVLSTDSRLSDARTPTVHAISHKATGGDVLAGIVGGYAPLDSGLLVPGANLATGTPTGLKFLRDDRVWAVPAGGGGSGLYSAYLCYQDQKAQNSAGGTFTSGAWRTRDLNTEVADTGNHGAVSGNQVTLDAGTYRFLATAPAWTVNRHQLRLRDVTNAVTLGSGVAMFAANGAGIAVYHLASVSGRFTLAGSAAIELQHQCQTTSSGSDGFGVGANFGTEVFASLELWKEA